MVEIRPKWDWKIRYCRLSLEAWTVLKSDQNGIERFSLSLLWLPRSSRLKSDQNGIERLEGPVWRIPGLLVEIRPKWDWKMQFLNPKRVRVKGWNQTKMGLKVVRVKQILKAKASWNQTKMGLKVLIPCLVSWYSKSWNQTKMGLKEP